MEPPRAQVHAGRLQLTDTRELVEVEDDVLGVVESLKRIDRGLRMFYNRSAGVFVLYYTGLNLDGQLVEELVGAYQELDQRIIELVSRLDQTGRGRYDLMAELDKLERERDAEQDARFSEQVGDAGERLRHSLRADLGLTGSRVYMNRRRPS